MHNKNKGNTLIWIILILAIALAVYFIAHKKTDAPVVPSQPTGNEVDTEVFVDPIYHFSLEYQPPFSLASSDVLENSYWSNISAAPGQKLVMVVIPQPFMPNTNFSEALISVGVSQDVKELGQCTAPSNAGENPIKSIVTIHGVQFNKFVYTEGAAGNFYKVAMYRTLRDGSCFSVESVIHSTNIGAYSPDQGITEFDKNKIEKLVEPVVNSFKFE